MALDFGLLDSRIPLSVKPINIDVAGTKDRLYKLEQAEIEQPDKLAQLKANISDRAVLADALNSGADLTSAKGLEDALSGMRDKLSPGGYFKMTDALNAARDQEAKRNEEALNVKRKISEAWQNNLNQAFPFVGKLLETTDAVYKQNLPKGEQEASRLADDAYKAGSAALFTDMSGYQMAPGVPALDPNVIKFLSGLPRQQLQGLYDGSVYRKGLLVNEGKEASAQEKLDQFIGSDGRTYGYSRTQNKYLVNGEWINDLPEGVSIRKASGPGSATQVLDPDSPEGQFLSSFQANNGELTKLIGSRTGAGNMVGLLRTAFNGYRDLGYTDPKEAGRMAATGRFMRDVAKKGASSVVAQDMVMGVSELSVTQTLDLIIKEADRLKQVDPQFVNKIKNWTADELSSDPRSVALGTYIQFARDHIAKLFANSTGVGASPTTYYEATAPIMNVNMPLEGILKANNAIRNEFSARRSSMEKQIANILGSLATQPNPNSPLGKEAAAAKAENKLSEQRSGLEPINQDQLMGYVVKDIRSAIDAYNNNSPIEFQIYKDNVKEWRAQLAKRGLVLPTIEGADKIPGLLSDVADKSNADTKSVGKSNAGGLKSGDIKLPSGKTVNIQLSQ